MNTLAKISIYSRMNDGRWLWSGDGELDGTTITDCAADLGEDVYEELESAVDHKPGSYTVGVDGVEYRIDVGEPYATVSA